MRKEVVFGINRYAKEGIIYAGSEPDPVNGYVGEYLGTFKIDDRDVMFTRTISPSSKESKRKKVKVNEVDFDVHYDGDIEVYYCYDKQARYRYLEELLNTEAAQRLLDDNKSISTVLINLDINFDVSNIGKVISRNLVETISFAQPEDHDYDDVMAEIYGQGNYEREATPISVLKVHATGVSPEAFESLKEVKDYCKNESHSLYGNAFEAMKKRRTLRSMITGKNPAK